MKTRVISVVCAVLLITSVLFFVLWQNEKNDQSDLRNIAAAAAKASRDDFWLYEETEDPKYYYSGVAEFCTFNTVYGQLVTDTNDSANALFCNEVYGILTVSPEKGMAHISEIIAAMELLTKDIDHPNAYNKMSVLRNSIKE